MNNDTIEKITKPVTRKKDFFVKYVDTARELGKTHIKKVFFFLNWRKKNLSKSVSGYYKKKSGMDHREGKTLVV